MRPAFEQFPQTHDFGFRAGHYQLAADLMRNAMLPAESLHLPDALDRQPGLQRSRLVVQAGVQDTAVVAALVLANLGLLLQHDHLGLRLGHRQPVRHSKADDSSAHHRVRCFFQLCSPRKTRKECT